MVSLGLGGDVARVTKRFNLGAGAITGGVELAHAVAHLHLPPDRRALADMVGSLFGAYLDKGIDHRCWEAPVLTPRQLEYAAADAWAHLRIHQVAPYRGADNLAGDGQPTHPPAPLDLLEEEEESIAPPESDEESDDDEEEEEEAEDPRTATYRHQQRPVPPGRRAQRQRDVRIGSSGRSFDPTVMAHVDAALGSDGAVAGSDDEGGDSGDEGADDGGDGGTGTRSAAAESTLQSARQRIEAYADSTRTSNLALPATLSDQERKELHALATTLKLEATSVGIGADRQLIVCRWKPLVAFTAAIGQSAVGGTVAKDAVPRASRSRAAAEDAAAAAAGGDTAASCLVRGTVGAFNAETMRWRLGYQDGSSECVGLDLLNLRLQRRHADDAISDGHAPPTIGSVDPSELEAFLSGIRPSWAKGRLKYDIRHFMANFSGMVAAEKSSPAYGIFMAYVSAAIFKILPGEHDRVRRHMVALGMSNEAINRAPRRYWRRMVRFSYPWSPLGPPLGPPSPRPPLGPPWSPPLADPPCPGAPPFDPPPPQARYSCPEPEIIIRGLYDIFNFFKGMKDPARPEHDFFIRDAWQIFTKEIAYVQKGYLSDVPGMNMYTYVRTIASTGCIVYRGKRSSSALEGYHLHLRAAQHPCAKISGYKLETARR